MNWLLQVFDPANIGAFFTQLHADVQQPAFWLAVGKIIWINVLLSGDNALVIAMACRGLQPRQRLWGMVIGAGIAGGPVDRFHRDHRDADGAALSEAGWRAGASGDRRQASGP